MLLSKASVTATCLTCHDGTGGSGVYGTIQARTGAPPAAMHRCDTTNVVPGGNATTGGSATMAFAGPDGTMGCDDCHSPHDYDTVKPFAGKRLRLLDGQSREAVTSKLLRRHPGGSPVEVVEYGSDWCLGCHQGRANRTASHDHPVETTASPGGGYNVNRVPVISGAADVAPVETSEYWLGRLAGPYFQGGNHQLTTGVGTGNRGYLMVFPRVALQQGHYPMCQQCHGDARPPGGVGTLTQGGTKALATNQTLVPSEADGMNPASNPRFLNFPHEAANPNMLVETGTAFGSDLCTNCHP